MKAHVILSTILLAATPVAQASDWTPAGYSVVDGSGSTQLSSHASISALPGDATLREIQRLYRRGQHHATLHYMPDNWSSIGWSHDGTLGFISATPFENSHPLYMCQLHNIAWGYLTSKEPGCEGQFLTPFGMIGYISSVARPDTVPLYRCHYLHKGQLKHFDTRHANCENVPSAKNDGILGYMFL